MLHILGADKIGFVPDVELILIGLHKSLILSINCDVVQSEKGDKKCQLYFRYKDKEP